MSDNFEPGLQETAPEAEPKARKTRAKKAAAGEKAAKPKKAARETKATTAGATTRKAKSKAGKEEAETPAKKKVKAPGKKKVAEQEPVAVAYKTGEPVEDPIGDVSDGEGWAYTGDGLDMGAEAEAEAYRVEAEIEAVNGTVEPPEHAPDAGGGREPELEPEMRAPAHLERLQKILSQAGIASRRRAEEMIVGGRVMVNGHVVTALGTKADPERDHIRVDGKLLRGAERHRYFVLNKPRGYVTTVSDPEGRPTVMDFVAKLGERVYPVGRLDFQSEGLLLMTNDGELANRLTRASSGVEKTYLVKVAGQPSEEDLDKLRSGVAIDRGQSGSRRVRTAPARVRQVRKGENPWYEVVLTEGRNRELRKMFGAVGHFVEKIRRVAYGPLVLDLEPGKLRELTPDEVTALRLTAEGKLKPRRVKTEAMLPKEAGRSVGARPERPFAKHGRQRAEEREFRPRGEKPFRAKERPPREFREERPARQARPRFERQEFPGRPRREREEHRFEERPRGPFRPRGERPEFGGFERPKPRPFSRPKQFDQQDRSKPFEKPRRFETPRQFERPKQWTGRRPDEGADRGPGGGPDRGFGKGPGRSWNKPEGARPFRKEGGGPGFREKGRTHGGKAGGFQKGGFKSRPGTAGKPGGERRGPQRPFGKRPGGKPRG